MNARFIVSASKPLHGTLRVPGDKSISHRAIMIGAIAEGTTRITGFLEGEDTLCTLAALQALGVTIDRPAPTRVIIHGVGLHGLQAPRAPLYLGNSGTSMRLLAGLLAGQTFFTELHGDASLSRRPMRRVTEPLAQMGARLATTAQGTPPLHIHGQSKHTPLHGIDYTLPVASAQVKSCLLLAGLYAQGTTCITEPAPTRDHTERLLAGFGYPVQCQDLRVCLTGGSPLRATTVDVPADLSSAAFFIVGASIAEHSDILLQHVGINPTRTGIIDILQQMGADIEIQNAHTSGGESIADIRVRYRPLHGITIPENLVSLAIDEFPIIFIAAACAKGTTVLTGAAELRVKESDRIQVMADGLRALGVNAQPTPDGMIIHGGPLHGGVIDSHGDHRVAMAFTIAALRANTTITINDCENVATSFPNFVDLAQRVGITITSSR